MFHESLADLDCIDWFRLQNRDFRRDNRDPEKMERYQAGALVYPSLPVNLLELVGCRGSKEAQRVQALVQQAGAGVRIAAAPRL